MARLIQYEDLSLAVEPEGDGYRVRTLSSPYGPAAAPFALPLRRRELEEMIRNVGSGLRCSNAEVSPQVARELDCVQPRRASERIFQETGALLFQALFRGAVRETYLLSRGRTESFPDHGLRIRIVLPGDMPDAGLLQALPWELLYCEETSDFLARNVLTPVVRNLPIPWLSSPFPAAGTHRVRILIVVAQPRGAASLDEADERARILAAWCQRQGTEVKVLRPAILRDLYEALRWDHFHVVHFIAHGDFDTETGVGSLLLETAEGGPHAVPSNVLAETLRTSRELRLVFLNSCKSARVGERSGQDPLSGVAAALVRRGLPAVLAMQFPITDLAARIFSEAVYRSLARGSSLEAAVADGRLALYQADPQSWEWITPALFAALSESDVFRPLCAMAEERTAESEEVEETVAQASRLLGTQLYLKAQQVVEARLEQGASTADLHYYLALALLGDRRPRFLKLGEIKPIEASARRAVGLPDCAAHHLCLLAFLQRDFYLENYLSPPPPSYEELVQRAAAARWEPRKLDELAQLVPWARSVVDLVSERVGRTT